MADTLFERITGRSAAAATPIAVNLVLSDETLLGGSSAAADICGYGPIPATVARELVSGAVTDDRSRATMGRRRCDQCEQRPRLMRTMQLRQRGRRLGRQTRCR